MTARLDLNLLRTFAAVYQTKSFSLAGEQLDVPRSTVSRAVSALEDSLGAALFHRTTRRVAATAAAEELFGRVHATLALLEQALSELPEAAEQPSGLLRVTATADVATVLLAETVARYRERFPRTRVELVLSPRVLDLARERLDLALRVSRGPLAGPTLVSRKLGSIDVRLYASPAYLRRNGQPHVPEDLRRHSLVSYRSAGDLPIPTKVRLRLPPASVICEDMAFNREVIRCGGGVGILPAFLASADVEEGRLVPVLPAYFWKAGSVHLLTPSRRHVPSKVTAFRDVLLEVLRGHPLGQPSP